MTDGSKTDTPDIETTADGPFLVHGHTIREADYVYGEHGEPMTWTFGDAVDTDDDTVALCRCGQSSNRPFCDGSHQDAEWDPSDAATPDAPYEERARRKTSGPYTMLDDTKLCMHAGLCGTDKQTVWQMLNDDADSETRGTVIRMVEKCPSGRLSNVIDGDVVEPRLPTEVNVVPGGPLWVTGALTVTNASGDVIETRNRVTLCRCGASENKPLCDGSHKDIDFEQ